MINEKEKELYNLYLTISRSCRNKPFKLRKNFDDFEDTKEHNHVRKLCRFLRQFPQIKAPVFFKAPFELYKDLEYVGLDFYSSPKAIKAYTTYMQQLQEESPDSHHHITFIKDSLRFIGMFCIKNKISIKEYPTFSLGSTYTWMKHVKEHNVSIYVMFSFPKVFDIIRSVPNDELDLFLGNIAPSLAQFKNRYDTSKEARRIVKEGFKRITPVVEKSL